MLTRFVIGAFRASHSVWMRNIEVDALFRFPVKEPEGKDACMSKSPKAMSESLMVFLILAMNVFCLCWTTPATPGFIYAGTDSGVYISSNSGGSWTAVSSGLPSGAAVTSLAVDSATSTTLYAGTDASGVYMSTNWGESWTAANSPASRPEPMSIAWQSTPGRRPLSMPELMRAAYTRAPTADRAGLR